MQSSSNDNQYAVLLGMPRAATTFLYHHFEKHPEIFVPFRRKTNYFSLHFESKPKKWFFQHFCDAQPGQICIDTETIGFINQDIDIIQRLDDTLPSETRYILCVREPGEWLFSLYNQLRKFDSNIKSFSEFVSNEYVLTTDGVKNRFNYQNGDIKRRIELLIEHFGERLLVIDFAELQRNPGKALTEIEDFLGLSSYFKEADSNYTKINAGDNKNITFFSRMLRNNLLIKIASLLPSSFVKYTRMKLDSFLSLKSKQNKEEKALPQNDSELLIAREKFSLDVEYYHTLTAKS